MNRRARTHSLKRTRSVKPVKLATDGVRNVTFSRKLEDESGSSMRHTEQLSQKIIRCFGKEPIAIIQPRKNEGPDESVACIIGERLTDRTQLTYVKVQCTCQLGDVRCQTQRS